jgi:hypothetical protein
VLSANRSFANTDSGASIIPDLRPTKELQHSPILCCRFDDLRGDLGVTSIGLVKIDVEGAERQVLHGMERSLRELRAPILCEILYADAHADILRYERNVRSIMHFLDQLEYTVFRIKRTGGKAFPGAPENHGIPDPGLDARKCA